MKKVNQQGFSLLELMIGIAILGILVAVALPSYRSFVAKNNRAQAELNITDAMHFQEVQLRQNLSYSTDLVAIGVPANTINDDFYALTATVCGAGINIANCARIVATAQGSQLNDTECREIWMDTRGLKGSNDANNAASTGCWD